MDFLTLSTQTTKNIGDEIQQIAANRFLREQSIVGVIDRERLDEYSGKPVKLIMNGWYFHDSSHWPPAKNISPLVTSFHISDLPGEADGINPRETLLDPKNIHFIKSASPIGARDIEVHDFLSRNDIPTYFSGCLTLTLEPRGVKKNDKICCVDLNNEVINYIKNHTNRQIIELHNSEIPEGLSHDEKIERAQQTLDDYEASSLVISSRLHAVLPALALGTPAILLHNKNKDASRYAGLKEFVKNCSEEDFLAGLYDKELQSPSPNQNFHLPVVENLTKIISGFINDITLTELELAKISESNLKAVLAAKEYNDKQIRQLYKELRPKKSFGLKRLFSS